MEDESYVSKEISYKSLFVSVFFSYVSNHFSFLEDFFGVWGGLVDGLYHLLNFSRVDNLLIP